MKKNNQLHVIQALVCVLFFGFFGCAGKEPAVKQNLSLSHNAVNWNQVKENTWQLVSVRNDRMRIDLDRENHKADRINETYTLRFTGDFTGKSIYGKGAPNTYSASCDVGDDFTIGFGPIVSTKMVAFIEPEVLKEHEYFKYLEKVCRWTMDYDEHLKLFTTNEEGEEVFLIFRKI